jgi:SAM-dependent methyltransferase
MKTKIKRAFKIVMSKVPLLKEVVRTIDNQEFRDEFVVAAIKAIPSGKVLLDAGCGSQRYRKYCGQLVYKAQDFGQFTVDEMPSLSGFKEQYQYGKIDYRGNIWEIDEEDGVFDVILCTEVFEHIAYPIETIKEFSRLLKKGGKLILTAPSNCLRHMDPYYFYSGFSNRWYQEILSKFGFKIERLEQAGDYYSWMRGESAKTMIKAGMLAAILLFPSFMYYSLKKRTAESLATLCEGYHIIAIKM